MGLLQSLCFIVRRWLRASGVSRLLCCLHFHANIHDSRYDCDVTSCRLTIWSHPGHDGGHLQCQCWGIQLLLPVQACWSSTCLMDVAWEAPILQGWGWSFKDSPFPSPHPDYCDEWFEIWSNPCSLVYYCSFIRWPSLFPVVSYMALIRVLLTKAPVANNWDQSCVCRWPSERHISSTTCCSSELLQPYQTLSSTWLLLLLEFHMAHFSLQPYSGSSQPPSYLFEWVLLLLTVCFISDSYPLWPFFFLFLWGLVPMI